VKIRNLELEVSRLLTENLDLRTQIIQLHGELDDVSRNQIVDHVEAVRMQLELKVAEFAGLLTEMGTVGEEPRRRRMNRSLARPTTARPPSAALDLRSGDEKLPTIVEGKHFPRKTLEYVPRPSASFIYNLLTLQGTAISVHFSQMLLVTLPISGHRPEPSSTETRPRWSTRG